MSTQGKPQQSNQPLVDLKDVLQKHLIFESRIWCVGRMLPCEFDRLVQSHVTQWKQMDMLLTGIDRKRYDRFEKWFLLNELVLAKKLKLYDTYEQAEQALRSVA